MKRMRTAVPKMGTRGPAVALRSSPAQMSRVAVRAPGDYA